jgi:sigma-E factor negative regulatory protein RseA
MADGAGLCPPGALELRALLSALADGHAGESGAAAACMAWSDDPMAQQTWHEYQVIGDLMRSADAGPVSGDGDLAFLAVMRTRLAAERVERVETAEASAPAQGAGGLRAADGSAASPVYHPARLEPHGARRWQRWWTPAAVAAGFGLVAAALLVTRGAGPVGAESGAALARGAVEVGAPAAQQATAAASGSALVVDARVIRDARLDEYLQAHRAAAATQVLRPAASGLRNVDVMLPQK